MKLNRIAALGLFAAACGTSEGPDPNAEQIEDRRIALPAAPGDGVQIVMPELTIDAGSEKQLCWFTSLPNTESVWVKGYDMYQGTGGHHLVMFTTVEDVADGTIVDCSDATRMKFWTLLLVPTKKDERFDLPEGYAMEIPPGAKLVVQAHYINTSTKKIKVRDAINVYSRPKTDSLVRVAPFATGGTDFLIPPGEHTERYRCDVSQDMNAVLVLAHMHEWGSKITIETGAAEKMEKLLEVEAWDPSMRDQPPLLRWPYDAPKVLHAGDALDVTCSWNNTSGADLGFPKEMCASVLFFYPAEKPVTCSGARMP